MDEKTFLQRRLEREEENFYKKGDEFDYVLDSTMVCGLGVISEYQNFDSEKVNYIAQSETYQYFSMSENPYRTIEEIMSKKCFFYNAFEAEEILFEPVTLKSSIIDPTFYNLMRNYFDYTADMTTQLFLDFFIQSFVDSFNACYENGPSLLFSSQRDVRKRAMSEGNQEILGLLNQREYIGGFSAEGIVSVELEDLEKILGHFQKR